MSGRNGFGNTRRLPSGSWQARYYGPDMARHIAPKTFRTKGDAQAWLAEERRLISQQRWSSPSERTAKAAATEAHRRARTFAVYAEQWLATRVTSKGKALRPTTRAGYRNSLDVHILPRFGSLSPGRDHPRSRRSWRGQFSAADMTPPGRRLTSS